MNLKIIHKWRYIPPEGKVFRLPSLTVPDQTMSIKTILERYTRGLPVTGVMSEPIWDGDEPQIDMRTLDLAEREDLVRIRKDELQALTAKIETDKRLKAKAAEERRRSDDLAKATAEQPVQQQPVQP